MRSAHEASWASWVTTTPVTPSRHAERSSRITASPFTESSAPVGSSARRMWRSPTMARAMATRWRSPPERSSGNRSALSRTSEALERFQAGRAGPLRPGAVELEREGDVLEGGEPGEEVEVLEHVADGPAAQRGPVVGRQGRQVVAVDEHLARRRLLHRTGDGEQRALARAARPHHGDERARRDLEVDVDEGIDPGWRPRRRTWTRRGGRWRSSPAPDLSAQPLGRRARLGRRGVRAGVGRRLRRPSTLSSQRISESSRNSSASATSRRPSSSSPASSLSRVYCCISSASCRRWTCRRAGTSTSGRWRATSTLMTSSSRGGDVMSGGVRSQVSSSSAPAVGQREDALRAGAVVVGVDEAVALEPLEGRVDLPDVERPHLAGAVLELLAELQPVLRSFAEQGEEGVADAHG